MPRNSAPPSVPSNYIPASSKPKTPSPSIRSVAYSDWAMGCNPEELARLNQVSSVEAVATAELGDVTSNAAGSRLHSASSFSGFMRLLNGGSTEYASSTINSSPSFAGQSSGMERASMSEPPPLHPTVSHIPIPSPLDSFGAFRVPLASPKRDVSRASKAPEPSTSTEKQSRATTASPLGRGNGRKKAAPRSRTATKATKEPAARGGRRKAKSATPSSTPPVLTAENQAELEFSSPLPETSSLAASDIQRADPTVLKDVFGPTLSSATAGNLRTTDSAAVNVGPTGLDSWADPTLWSLPLSTTATKDMDAPGDAPSLVASSISPPASTASPDQFTELTATWSAEPAAALPSITFASGSRASSGGLASSSLMMMMMDLDDNGGASSALSLQTPADQTFYPFGTASGSSTGTANSTTFQPQKDAISTPPLPPPPTSYVASSLINVFSPAPAANPGVVESPFVDSDFGSAVLRFAPASGGYQQQQQVDPAKNQQQEQGWSAGGYMSSFLPALNSDSSVGIGGSASSLTLFPSATTSSTADGRAIASSGASVMTKTTMPPSDGALGLGQTTVMAGGTVPTSTEAFAGASSIPAPGAGMGWGSSIYAGAAAPTIARANSLGAMVTPAMVNAAAVAMGVTPTVAAGWLVAACRQRLLRQTALAAAAAGYRGNLGMTSSGASQAWHMGTQWLAGGTDYGVSSDRGAWLGWGYDNQGPGGLVSSVPTISASAAFVASPQVAAGTDLYGTCLGQGQQRQPDTTAFSMSLPGTGVDTIQASYAVAATTMDTHRGFSTTAGEDGTSFARSSFEATSTASTTLSYLDTALRLQTYSIGDRGATVGRIDGKGVVTPAPLGADTESPAIAASAEAVGQSAQPTTWNGFAAAAEGYGFESTTDGAGSDAAIGSSWGGGDAGTGPWLWRSETIGEGWTIVPTSPMEEDEQEEIPEMIVPVEGQGAVVAETKEAIVDAKSDRKDEGVGETAVGDSGVVAPAAEGVVTEAVVSKLDVGDGGKSASGGARDRGGGGRKGTAAAKRGRKGPATTKEASDEVGKENVDVAEVDIVKDTGEAKAGPRRRSGNGNARGGRASTGGVKRRRGTTATPEATRDDVADSVAEELDDQVNPPEARAKNKRRRVSKNNADTVKTVEIRAPSPNVVPVEAVDVAEVGESIHAVETSHLPSEKKSVKTPAARRTSKAPRRKTAAKAPKVLAPTPSEAGDTEVQVDGDKALPSTVVKGHGITTVMKGHGMGGGDEKEETDDEVPEKAVAADVEKGEGGKGRKRVQQRRKTAAKAPRAAAPPRSRKKVNVKATSAEPEQDVVDSTEPRKDEGHKKHFIPIAPRDSGNERRLDSSSIAIPAFYGNQAQSRSRGAFSVERKASPEVSSEAKPNSRELPRFASPPPLEGTPTTATPTRTLGSFSDTDSSITSPVGEIEVLPRGLKKASKAKISPAFSTTSSLSPGNAATPSPMQKADDSFTTLGSPDEVEKYPCTICDKVFVRKHDLNRHLLKHNVASPRPKCDSCGKTFSRMDGLARHIKRNVCKHGKRMVVDREEEREDVGVKDNVEDLDAAPADDQDSDYEMAVDDDDGSVDSADYDTASSSPIRAPRTRALRSGKRSGTNLMSPIALRKAPRRSGRR
ncbi:hypothetical protein HDU96_001113 [Phlyctochytrium bullatum]|nr:hypothetical protein HDU96_001113 [Phlyctochytrium bullatum]